MSNLFYFVTQKITKQYNNKIQIKLQKSGEEAEKKQESCYVFQVSSILT